MERSAIILVVDDNEQNRALAQAALEEEGYEVRLASNGADAIR
jgi:CheY-like chemotaxis protein